MDVGYRGRRLREDQAVYSLIRKECLIDGRSVVVPKDHCLGNKSWGLIDFLRHYFDYTVYISYKTAIQLKTRRHKETV